MPFPSKLQLVAFLVGLVCILQNVGQNFIARPLNRLIELAICREYYQRHDPTVIEPDGNITERFCKLQEVQTRLAVLNGAISMSALTVELVVLLPYGWIADRFGRRTVLFLNALGGTLTFCWIMLVGYAYLTFSPLGFIAAPFFCLIGGSVNVFNMIVFTVIADVSKDTTQRTKIFGYFQAIGHILRLLSPALSSVIMEQNLYIPFWVGIACFALSMPLIALLPETRVEGMSVKPIHENTEASENNEVEETIDEETPLINSTNGDQEQGLDSETSHNETSLTSKIWRRLGPFTRLVLTNRNIALNFFATMASTLGRCSLTILAQYISYRYSWTFAQAGYLFSVKAGLGILLYVVLLPAFLHICTHRLLLAKSDANLYGAKGSIIFLIVGSIIMGLAPRIWSFIIGMVHYCLGSGLALFLLSLLTTELFKNLDKQHTGQLYSAHVLVEAIGEFIGIPMVSATMAAGVGLEGYGLGLPLYACAGFYVVGALAIWNIKGNHVDD